MKLTDLKVGQKAKILNIVCDSYSTYRLLEYGFTPNQEIEILNTTIFNDPIAVSLRGAVIALRKKDAEHIEIEILLT